MRATGNHKGRKVAVGLGLVLVVIAIGAVLLLLPSSRGGGIKSVQESTTTNTSNPQLAYLSIKPTTPVLGSTNAPVTIFEFGDFQCTFCDQWYKTQEPNVIQNLVNTSQAKLAWKDFDYYGPDSTSASKAAYAAAEQGKFWQFYDLLYSSQQAPNSGWANQTNLQKFAQSLGLNMTQFNQSLNSEKYTSLIDSNFSDGRQLGVNGTPTFFVVGPTGKVVQIVGGQPYSVFQSAVNSVIR
jgi:protein-disulfide isomerase